MTNSIFDFVNKHLAKLPKIDKDLCFENLPVKTIHQSWLAEFRMCKRKAFFSSKMKAGPSPYYMFLGSVFHHAFEEAARHPDANVWYKEAHNPEYWKYVFTYLDQIPVDIDLDRYAMLLSNADTFAGISLAKIIHEALMYFRGNGFEIIGLEQRMEYNPGRGPIYVGTLDILLRRHGVTIIVDSKTSGLWGTFKGKTPVKQSYNEIQIREHLQLKHYHWLGWKSGLFNYTDVRGYGIFCPANLTKYLKGKTAGMQRGPPVFWAAVDPQQVLRYEGDMKAWLGDANTEKLWPRYYPGTFGKIECERCPFYGPCMSDKMVEVTPSYIVVDDEDEELV